IGQDLVTPLGLPVFGADPSVLRFPGITIRNFTGLGGNVAIPVFRAENNYQFIDNFSMQAGRHSLKMGAEVSLNQTTNKQRQTRAGKNILKALRTAVRGHQAVDGLPDMPLGLP